MCHDAFIGHARQRHDLIGCSETRSVGAEQVLNTRILMRLFTQKMSFVHCGTSTGIQQLYFTIVYGSTT